MFVMIIHSEQFDIMMKYDNYINILYLKETERMKYEENMIEK